jgi:adenosyl cobinamide kinase/adenosyl cobinamide phosphate guanylyltransferase
MALTLLVGGARSGKSELAVQLAARTGRQVTVLVTAEARDEEMAARIERHRARRPAGWSTVETPREVGRDLVDVPDEDCVVLDCLTLWIANLLERGDEDEAIVQAARSAAEIAARRPGPTIVVSNEVGSGIVPIAAVSRRYRDLVGVVNAVWAEAASHVGLVVAGRVLPLDLVEPEQLLG